MRLQATAWKIIWILTTCDHHVGQLRASWARRVVGRGSCPTFCLKPKPGVLYDIIIIIIITIIKDIIISFIIITQTLITLITFISITKVVQLLQPSLELDWRSVYRYWFHWRSGCVWANKLHHWFDYRHHQPGHQHHVGQVIKSIQLSSSCLH